jgi:hypothetical protein
MPVRPDRPDDGSRESTLLRGFPAARFQLQKKSFSPNWKTRGEFALAICP